MEPYVTEELKPKTHCLRNNCKDIWEWSEKVYEYVREGAGMEGKDRNVWLLSAEER